MRRIVAFSLGIILGVILGYEARGLVGFMVLSRRDPELMAAFYHTVAQSVLVCDCDHRPPQEEKQSLLKYHSLAQAGLAADPQYRPAIFAHAVVEARLSMVDDKLKNSTESYDYMTRAQRDFSTLGWRDVSPEHLRKFVAYFDHLDQKSDPAPKANSAMSPARDGRAGKARWLFPRGRRLPFFHILPPISTRPGGTRTG